MADPFRNRIIGHAELPPDEIEGHPLNWREHPDHQAAALRDVMANVGVVDEVIVNKRTGRLVNGHLRVRLAQEAGQAKVPVKYVDLSEDEERVILASFDAIGAMATIDEGALRALLSDAGGDGWHGQLADLIAQTYDLDLEETSPPDDFAAYDEDIEVENECPKCGYRFSGNTLRHVKDKDEA